jgi:hypothetical protein|tara:strand:- start:217 stop:333 length:117 start_codon:yes stop_codon:yes gene_type:complete
MLKSCAWEKEASFEASTVHRGSLKMVRPVLDEREELHG